MCRTTLTAWVALFVALSASGQTANKPVATVNGETISRGELDAALRVQSAEERSYVAAQQLRIDEQILSLLIDDRLIHQYVAKNAPPVSVAAVDKKMSMLLDALKAQKSTLADYCRETHQTEKQVRAGLESVLRWNAYLATKMTDVELQKYYSANREHFNGARVQCSHIVYYTSEKATPAEREMAATKMRDLRRQVLEKKYTFTQAAQKFSHAPDAKGGGNLGWIQRKWTVEEPIAKAAFALGVGEMSDVIVTDGGVHLIAVTDREAGQNSDFDKVKNVVQECYADELRLSLITELRKTAKIEVFLK
jgi:parvulin-like peptidyl-prolyl isomerase